MPTINRREFIKGAGTALAWLALPRIPIPIDQPFTDQPASHGCRHSDAAPSEWRLPMAPLPAPAPEKLPSTSLGRIATWWRHAVRSEPTQYADVVAWKRRDEVIPLHGAVAGDPPWPNNPIWYVTDEGFIHSGYVQPVENTPSAEVVAEVAEPGFWAQVCVPIAEARWQPTSPYVGYKLYHGTIYRVAGATADEEGNWWYQLKEGITYSPGPYVPAWSVRRIPPEELAPISPGHPDKWIQINIEAQSLTCFEGESAVFSTAISSGAAGTRTPRGEHRVLYKRCTSRMAGGTDEDRYDLPGVAFPVYFTWSAVAIHGTYWHNDFCRPHSHGCVNVPNQAAQWIFRWTEPVAPYTGYKTDAVPGMGTRIVVV